MKLLIVDDQKTVVDGLLAKVDWTEIGISSAVGSYSAMEARNILTRQAVDVMLCDIEMPMESGLSLFEWMRGKGIRTRCIFLTAHAEFSYARKSVSLGAFDYVLQPAPYSEICAAVKCAVEDIRSERDRNFSREFGQVAAWKKNNAVATALSSYLRDGKNAIEIYGLSRSNVLPGGSQRMELVLLQIQRWSSIDVWTDEMLTISIGQVVWEIFSPYGQTTLTAVVKEGCFALLIWSGDYQIAPESMAYHLEFLSNVCQQNLQCTIALYHKRLRHLDEIRSAWEELILRMQENVTRKNGVFPARENGDSMGYEYYVPAVRGWVDLLHGDDPRQVEQQADRLLNTMEKHGELSTEVLRNLYQDFLQVVRSASENGDSFFWREVLTDSESYDIYRFGMKTAKQLKALIHLAVSHFEKQGQVSGNDIVERISNYIDEHLDSDICRNDLAAHVYLNPDYLNRMFKKKTGCTLKEYMICYKMKEAANMLKKTNLPVSIIAAKVGYCNYSHFSYAYKKVMGQSPIETRNRQQTADSRTT